MHRPCWYHLVPDQRVRPAAFVPLAARLSEWASRDLGLTAPPAVVWFTRRQQGRDGSRSFLPRYLQRRWPAPNEPPPPPYTLTEEEALEVALNSSPPPTTYGRVVGLYPATVFLRTVRSSHAVAYYLLHECRHVWQFAAGTMPTWSVEQAEADADAYRDRVLLQGLRMIQE